MKVLVVGGGGREHTLAWKASMSPLVDEVICAPGNGGIRQHARCVALSAQDVEGQVDLAVREKADLVIVGPEVPLVDGLVDKLEEAGIPAFGPSAKAAQLEGSKVFSKEFMKRHGIPTAAFTVHRDLDSALAQVDRRNGPCVIKADGLAAGKGVIVCANPDEARQAIRDILGEKRFGDAGSTVIIEDLLVGEEASILAICDGKKTIPLIAAQDHKAAYDGDSGPNTGGMGAYAPAPVVTPALHDRIVEEVLTKTIDGMAKDGTPFRGILYAGLMISEDDIKVLEFNVRFGDPECQPLLMLMKSDIVPILMAAAKGDLGDTAVEWHSGSSICVVLAAGGYPGPYKKGMAISGLDDAGATENVMVFHAGTKAQGDDLVTSGGRVLGVTGIGSNLGEAARCAYDAADKISWDGMRMRRDIGHRAL